MSSTTAPAHRLALTGPEWLALWRTAGATPPEGFGPDDEVGEEELASAELALIERDVVGAGTGPHPSVAANLAIWVEPAFLIRADVSIGGRGLRAAYAVRGPLGASMFTLADASVELSMFPAIDLGVELRRCVPEIPPDASGRTTMDRLVPGAPTAPVHGRLPLSALADHGTTAGLTPGAPGGLTEADAALAAELNGRTIGVLQCLVVGARTGEGNPALAGNVVWYATDAGWVGVSPHPDGSGRQLVDLVPVDREAIGSWLAPYLARILEATDG